MAIQKNTRFRRDMTEQGRPTIDSASNDQFDVTAAFIATCHMQKLTHEWDDDEVTLC